MSIGGPHEVLPPHGGAQAGRAVAVAAARADAWAVVAVAVTPVFWPQSGAVGKISERDRRERCAGILSDCGSPVDDVLGSLFEEALLLA